MIYKKKNDGREGADYTKRRTQRSQMVKLIIDTDGVTDDIRAITLAIQHPEAELIALTTVQGCVNVHQATANVLRIQKANGLTKMIPIYKGAERPIIVKDHQVDETFFFGGDGMGDIPDMEPKVTPNDKNAHEKEHAALALIRLTREHPDATVVAIGPLTNLALALKMDPKFAKQPKQLVLMGGNYFGIGNVHSNSSAEYNFYGDPEAASIVLKEMECPLTVVPWEGFYLEGRAMEKRIDFTAHMQYDNALGKYLMAVTEQARQQLARSGRQYAFCDEIAVSTAIDASKVVLRKKDFRVSVELAGMYSRGQCVVDWTEQLWSSDGDDLHNTTMDLPDYEGLDQRRRPITFVTSYNVDVVNEWMHNAVKNSSNPRAA